MKAGIGNGVKIAAHVEDADLFSRHCEHLMRAFRQSTNVAHQHVFTHRLTPSKARSRNAFVPKSLRRTSSETGICRTLLGWSKSWCGQSDEKMTESSPLNSDMNVAISLRLAGSSMGWVEKNI